MTSEHTGLLRMGLEVSSSQTFWSQARAGETLKDRLLRAQEEDWFPGASEARRRYLLVELEKRFPAATLASLQAWSPTIDEQAALVCHWHLQWSDPLYRDFTSSYLVSAWARPDAAITVSAAEAWLARRGTHSDWSPSTRRRLASGLVAAASDAGFLKGQGRDKTLRTVTVDTASLAYLRWLLDGQTGDDRLGEEIFFSGMVRENNAGE